MEDDFDALHCLAGDARFAQVGFGECNAARLDVIFNVAQASAGEIVDDMNLSTALDERVYQVRADEGSPPGN